MLRKSALWNFCCGIVIVLSILAFSPIVLTQGKYTPELFGVPRTLWIGIILAFGLVAMTLIGGIVHPANHSEHDQSRDRSC